MLIIDPDEDDSCRTVAQLLALVASGEIAVPLWQRAFVWQNHHVAELFGSLYGGWSINTVVLWDAPECRSTPIGVEPKPAAPRWMVVDGQQRLTSLYAVMRGATVRDRRGKEVRCRFAFHPGTEHFTPTSARIRKNPEYLPDISVLWSGEQSLHQITEAFTQRLEGIRAVSAEEQDRIAARLRRLQSITASPVILWNLHAGVTLDRALRIFWRSNSDPRWEVA